MRAVAFSLIPFLACAACGCGTIDNIVGAGTPAADPSVNITPHNVIYGGVKQDAEYAWQQLNPVGISAIFSGPFFFETGLYHGLCAIVDIPFSAVGDTLTLPITIPATIAKAELQHSNTPIPRDENTTDPTRK
jgi:uncharacterized protein YceK